MTTKDLAPSVWQQRRLRIAQQKKERKARWDARQKERQEAAAAEADDEEDEDTVTTAAPRKKKGKQAAAPARAGLLPRMPAMNTNRYTSVIIWLIGAYLTRAFILQIGVADAVATPIAFLVQWLLTRAESPLWRGHGYPRMAMIATAVDGAINTGGTWVYTKNIGNTDFWKMIQFAADDPTLVPSIGTQIAVAVAVGLLTAAAAEYFWNLPSK